MENIEILNKFIDSFDASIEDLESSLLPLLDKKMDEIAASEENSIERAKIYNGYAYVIISLLYAYLKSVGVNVNDHPVKNELQRVKQFMAKTEETKKSIASEDNKDRSLEESKEFLKNTLGLKSVTNHSVPESMKSPSISSSNFKSKHTKFLDETRGGARSEEGPSSKVIINRDPKLKKTYHVRKNRTTKNK